MVFYHAQAPTLLNRRLRKLQYTVIRRLHPQEAKINVVGSLGVVGSLACSQACTRRRQIRGYTGLLAVLTGG